MCVFNEIQFTKHFIEIFDVETNQFGFQYMWRSQNFAPDKIVEQTLESGYRNYGCPGKKTSTVVSMHLANSIPYL